MPKFNYTPLHIHTEYSFLDGLIRIKDLMKKAKELGLIALAITDHGISGIVEFYFACKEAGIKPILGTEMYITRDMDIKDNKNKKLNHLTLLAKNEIGFRNLLKLYTEGGTRGYYYKPRVDKNCLKQYSEGIIAMTACLGGKVPSLLNQDKYDEAKQELLDYKDIFGNDNVYIELMPNDLEEQIKVNVELLKLAEDTDTQTVITTDSHYLNSEDAEVQQIFINIALQKGHSGSKSTKNMDFKSKKFWLMSVEELVNEMVSSHPSIPKEVIKQSIKNTNKIAEQIEEYEIASKETQFPIFDLPEGVTADEYLVKLCWEQLPKFYSDDNEVAKQRLEYELSVITKLGFSSYFLLVHDLLQYCKSQNHVVGPGRGSAAGSIISYVLEIVRIDPLKFGLLFERFLNPDRAKDPDIDLDFASKYRDDVYRYLISKYGADKIGFILTYSKMKVKSAIKDIGRVMECSFEDLNHMTKAIPDDLNLTDPGVVDQVMNHLMKTTKYKIGKKMVAIDGRALVIKYDKVFKVAKKLVGLIRQSGKHPAGLVVAPRSISDYAPLCKDTQSNNNIGIPILQVDMAGVSKLKLLKIDLLVVESLDLIEDTLKEIKINRGIDLTFDDLDKLNLNDEKVYELINAGKTNKIFQLSSGLLKRLAAEVVPGNFDELAVLLALCRPAPLKSGTKDNYVKSKHENQVIEYLHPKIKDILEDTYGVIAYQEQTMRILSELSGISFGEVDVFRKILETPDEKKKNNKVLDKKIAEWKNKFMDGCTEKGMATSLSNKIFEWLLLGGGYSFNKSHCYSYAYNSYQMAYLKAYYYAEFMVCALRCEKKDEKKYECICECCDEGLPVLPVDINLSDIEFKIENKNTIRTGFINVKNIGEPAAKAIIENRPEGGYKTVEQFLFLNYRDMGAVKRVLEFLAKSGGFDCADRNRKMVWNKLQLFQNRYSEFSNININISNAFDIFNNVCKAVFKDLKKEKDYDIKEKKTIEKELLGFEYVIIENKMKFGKDESLLKKQEEISKMNNLFIGGQIISNCFEDNVYVVKVKKSNGKNAVLKLTEEQVKKYKECLFKDKYVEMEFENIDGKNKLKNIKQTTQTDVMQEDIFNGGVDKDKDNVDEDNKGGTPEIGTNPEISTDIKEISALIGLSGKSSKVVQLEVEQILLNGGKDRIKFVIEDIKKNKWCNDIKKYVKLLSNYSGKVKNEDIDFIKKNLYNDIGYKKFVSPKLLESSKEELIVQKEKIINKINSYEKSYNDNKKKYESDEDMMTGFVISMERANKALERVEYTLNTKYNGGN